MSKFLVGGFWSRALIPFSKVRTSVIKCLIEQHCSHHFKYNVDFGLAKQLWPEDKQSNGLYKLTGNTGSMRYMETEVFKEQPYNDQIDMYNLAIPFVGDPRALQTVPFPSYNIKMIVMEVFELGGASPSALRFQWGYKPFWDGSEHWRADISLKCGGCIEEGIGGVEE